MPKFRQLLHVVDRQGELARLVVDEVRKLSSWQNSAKISVVCSSGTLHQLMGTRLSKRIPAIRRIPTTVRPCACNGFNSISDERVSFCCTLSELSSDKVLEYEMI